MRVSYGQALDEEFARDMGGRNTIQIHFDDELDDELTAVFQEALRALRERQDAQAALK